MEITDEIEKERILLRISKYINIVEYYDIKELNSEEFMEKYGHWGISLFNHFEIRFYNDTNVLSQIKKMVPMESKFYFLPINNERKIFKDGIDFLERYCTVDHLKVHLIIVDEKLNWILIKDDFNKLIGIGNFIKKKMEKMIHIKFDNEKLMYTLEG